MKIRKFKKIVKFAKRFAGDEETAKIARRYLVMNSFDGVLTILGVVVGTYMAEGTAHPSVILSTGFGASLAMGVSGRINGYCHSLCNRWKKREKGRLSEV